MPRALILGPQRPITTGAPAGTKAAISRTSNRPATGGFRHVISDLAIKRARGLVGRSWARFQRVRATWMPPSKRGGGSQCVSRSSGLILTG
jgi:hypothetical protein